MHLLKNFPASQLQNRTDVTVQDEIWVCTKAHSFLMFSHLFLNQIRGLFSNNVPRVQWSQLGNVVGVQMQTFPLLWYQIRQQTAGLSRIRSVHLRGTVCWWNKWDNSQQAVGVWPIHDKTPGLVPCFLIEVYLCTFILNFNFLSLRLKKETSYQIPSGSLGTGRPRQNCSTWLAFITEEITENKLSCMITTTIQKLLLMLEIC